MRKSRAKTLQRLVEIAVIRSLDKYMDNWRKIPQKDCTCNACVTVRAVRKVFEEESRG